MKPGGWSTPSAAIAARVIAERRAIAKADIASAVAFRTAMPSRRCASVGATIAITSVMSESTTTISMIVIPRRIIPPARVARYIPQARAAGRINCARSRAFLRDPLSMRRFVPFVAVVVAACASAPPPPASVPVTPAPRVDTVAVAPPKPEPLSFQPLPLITWGAAPPGELRAIVPELTQDLRHQIVRLQFDWTRRAVVGATTLRIAAVPAGARLTEITLDAVDLRIQRVTHRDRPLGFTHVGAELRIRLTEPLAADTLVDVTIDYEAVQPARGAYFIDRRRIVWAQGFAEDTRYWVPTVDRLYDKTTWEFFVRVPSKERALSNGRLVGTRR